MADLMRMLENYSRRAKQEGKCQDAAGMLFKSDIYMLTFSV